MIEYMHAVLISYVTTSVVIIVALAAQVYNHLSMLSKNIHSFKNYKQVDKSKDVY